MSSLGRHPIQTPVRFGDPSSFFSSRRRHTTLVSDWSSDVCSSDLLLPNQRPRVRIDDIYAVRRTGKDGEVLRSRRSLYPRNNQRLAERLHPHRLAVRLQLRSEERRVGKGCRTRWSPCLEYEDERTV